MHLENDLLLSFSTGFEQDPAKLVSPSVNLPMRLVYQHPKWNGLQIRAKMAA
jgi:hypothetical protein